MSSTGSATPARVHRLPVVGALRLGRPSDVWFKPALSVVAAVAPPSLLLVALGRLDLAAYTMAGSLCARTPTTARTPPAPRCWRG
ncbi:hypothetical protein SALBM217S_06380 [Streptomyces griseoloalbus]